MSPPPEQPRRALPAQGRYAEAEPLSKRALAISEKALGPEHPDVAVALNNLAAIYRAQGRYAEAEPLYKRALAIGEKTLGPEHPDVAIRLNNLAVLYGRKAAMPRPSPCTARPRHQREGARPGAPGCRHPLDNLAVLYERKAAMPRPSLCTSAPSPSARRRSARSTRMSPSVSTISRRSTGRRAAMPRPSLCTSAPSPSARRRSARSTRMSPPSQQPRVLYRAQGRYAEAEPLYKRALAISEKGLGIDHPNTEAIRRDLQTLRQPPAAPADGLRGGQSGAGDR